MQAELDYTGPFTAGLLSQLSPGALLQLMVPVAVLGAVLGSFLNVCIVRWPAEQSVVRPRSRCPRCERPIAWYENLPIVSWVALRGRCRGCGQGISWQYPLVELSMALWWVACVLAFGFTFEAGRVALYGMVLAGIAITDARHYLIPDGFTVSGLLLVLVTAVVNVVIETPSHFVTPWPALLGACVGAGAITIIGWLGEVMLKKEAMGFGDATLMAVVGAAVGAERVLMTIGVGAFLGSVVFLSVVGPVVWLRSRRRGEPFAFPEVPFGVFLAPAGLLTLLWGDALIAWYLQLFTA